MPTCLRRTCSELYLDIGLKAPDTCLLPCREQHVIGIPHARLAPFPDFTREAVEIRGPNYPTLCPEPAISYEVGPRIAARLVNPEE